MPIGVPIRVATTVMTTLPKIALASPPALPGGGVGCGEHVEAEAVDAVVDQRPEDRDQPEQADRGGADGERQGGVVGQAATAVEGHGSAAGSVSGAQLPRRRFMRISSSLAIASTMKVMTNRIRPSAISDDR